MSGVFPAPRRMTRRLGTVVLAGQAPVLFLAALGAWALVRVGDPSLAARYFWVGSGLTVACVLAAGLVRTRAGIAFGWLVQLATLACALVLRPMIVVALIFGGLWMVALVQGRKMDDLSERYAERAGPAHADDEAPTQ